MQRSRARGAAFASGFALLLASTALTAPTAAVAQVCYQNETPWAAVRVISDGLNDRINPTQVLDYASSTATTVLRDIILHMLGAPDDV